MGYHKKEIQKGVLGFSSKIQEELDELKDAEDQGAQILILNELADLYGALSTYVEYQFPWLKMEDIVKMSELTKSAFKDGHRK